MLLPKNLAMFGNGFTSPSVARDPEAASLRAALLEKIKIWIEAHRSPQ
jgi:hypothetical protein